jgi:AcrR family transcriptional regulator
MPKVDCVATPLSAAEPADGRARRSDRSRRAIVEALFALVGEGVLLPTAQQVADRAGVGIRSVFRHFEDMDSLYAELGSRIRTAIAPLTEAPLPGGSLEQRARELVRRRAALFERIAPYKRAADLQRWSSPFLREGHRGIVRELRVALLRLLPELERAPAELTEALDLAASFEAWDRLRSEQRLGPARARAATLRIVLALVSELNEREEPSR